MKLHAIEQTQSRLISTRSGAGASGARPRSRTRRRSPRPYTETCPSPGPSGAARHLSRTCRRSPGRAWRRPWARAPSGPHFYTSLCAKSSCARRPTPPRRRVCVGRVCVGPAPPRRRRDPVCVRVAPTPSSPRRRSCDRIQVIKTPRQYRTASRPARPCASSSSRACARRASWARRFSWRTACGRASGGRCASRPCLQ